VWIDDHLAALDEDDDFSEPRSAHVGRLMDSLGIAALFIAPDKTVGLTKADWDGAREWLT